MTRAHTLTRILPGQHQSRIIKEMMAALIEAPFQTLLLLPTSRHAGEVRQRLLDEGLSLIESSISTLSGYADAIIETHAGAMRRISDHEKELIIAAILEDGLYPLIAPKKHSVSGIAGELRVLFDVLQSRKIAYPGALGDLQSRKSDEIGGVFQEYQRYLLENNLLDRQGSITHATDWIRQNGGPKNVFIYGLYEPHPIEQDMLLALKGSSGRFLYALPWMDDSRCFSDDGSWLGILKEEDRTVQPPVLARFFDDPLPDKGYPPMSLTRYRDPVDELGGIATSIRTLIDEGASPGDITLVFPAIADAAILIEEIFTEYGIPYSTSTGKVLTRHPLVQSLLRLIELPLSGYRREDLISLLRSPYFRYYSDYEGTRIRLRSDKVDLLSRKAGVQGGEEDWRDRITRYIRSEEECAATFPEEKAHTRNWMINDLQVTLAGIESLIGTLNTLQGEETLAGHLRRYRILLATLRLPNLPPDGDEEMQRREEQILQAFISMLEELERGAAILPKRRIPLSSFLSILSSAAGRRRVTTRRNRHLVTVAGIREVQHLNIPHLFIAGLTEGVMPRIAPRLPLCTYAETRQLETLSGREIIRNERYYFLAALLSAGESISLSYPATDGEKVLLRSGFIASLPETDGHYDGRKYSRIVQGISAGRLLAEGEIAKASSLLGRDLLVVADRISIEDDRRSSQMRTECNGFIGEDNAITASLQKRFGDETVFSATQLEAYARCPFSFYLRYILGIEPLPDIDLDMTALERGNLIHRIAYRFYTGGRSPPSAGTFADSLETIRSICRDELQRYDRRSPVWIVEGENLLGSDGHGLLEEFLRYEMRLAESPFAPVYCEYSFGLSAGERYADPTSTPEPVRITLDDESVFLLKGKVDRIDTTPNGRFCIIDYKTGSSPGLQDITDGIALQLPLYIRAVENCLGLSPAGGAYYTMKRGDVRCQALVRDQAVDDYFLLFARSRDGGKRPLDDLISESLGWVRRYLEGIRSGQFPITDTPKRCSEYCNYRSVCRFDPLRLISGGDE
ncbi:hypothetical protein RJ53_02675 [Methanocalculus chunghsingensis]|uniref:UvrD-like helicase C-terminal domain-containing protein n=1 Tax=Methanocalculus chunghsingensis TaxID=156457 RepID=A0A8J7W8W2_9EURY|nr:PD-(D/E)XK nuclease family protein [Methanocalculus chunghsingensis]MBR1368465.1 hypothetical protein [Methanocalculus chunghsingensis]